MADVVVASSALSDRAFRTTGEAMKSSALNDRAFRMADKGIRQKGKFCCNSIFGVLAEGEVVVIASTRSSE